ncbi:alpha/beta fold hydrolase [Uliginosibacterium sp. 31-12]|uniref:alpha/beta fold hydrolase n=1 Tax=Uliginosibacterium sp. 31-12 TaxID=3062781 RepID=UPI0026E153D7|nr:alpha/beta fold hydrolase [Uliginosibacterium sp. 31-12]MDO6385509.1 alpha/beta fold hydrolase [Uliginosibacterium sp. 31-12]
MTPALVFLPGWAYQPTLWDTLRATLSEFPSHAPELPIHAGGLECWADTLAGKLPENALLVGWSLGAMIALVLAAQHPEKVRGLYLIGATPRFVTTPDWPHGLDASTVSAFRRGFSSSPERTLQRFLTLQVLGDARRSTLTPQLEACLAKTTEPGLDEGLQQLERAELRPLLAHVRQPVYLLHGNRDALMPVGAAKWLAAQLPTAKLETLAEAGHAPLFDQIPELARRIRSFANAR